MKAMLMNNGFKIGSGTFWTFYNSGHLKCLYRKRFIFRRNLGTLMNMPALSPTMEEGKFIKWNLKLGDEFSAGDSIAEIETDKATMDFEVQEDGVLAHILKDESTPLVKVGDPIAVWVSPGENWKDVEIPNSQPLKARKSAGKEVQSVKKNVAKSPNSVSRQPNLGGVSSARNETKRKTLCMSPAVARLLRENGLNEELSISATGPKSNFLKGDILEYLGQIPIGSTRSLEARLQKLSKLLLPEISKTDKGSVFVNTTGQKLANGNLLKEMTVLSLGGSPIYTSLRYLESYLAAAVSATCKVVSSQIQFNTLKSSSYKPRPVTKTRSLEINLPLALGKGAKLVITRLSSGSSGDIYDVLKNGPRTPRFHGSNLMVELMYSPDEKNAQLAKVFLSELRATCRSSR